jgi:undecaprenyl-diphosphatase
MLSALLNLDERVSRFLSGIVPSNPVTDWIFLFLSFEVDALLLLAVGLAVAVLFRRYITKALLLLLILAPVVSFFTTEVLLKPLFQRPRPYLLYPEHAATCPDNYSFPSGHASLAMSGAVILAYFDPKRALFYYLSALAICYSRIYLLCHYVLDVAAGSLVGVGIALLLLYLWTTLSGKKVTQQT